MRSGAILGLAAMLTAVPAVADSAPHGGAGMSAMHVGGAPMGGAPVGPPPSGGWGAGGWHGGGQPGGGMPGGHPGYPGGMAGHPGGMPGHPGYPGGMHPGGPGGWHGGGHAWGNWAGGGAYHRPYRGGRLNRFYIAPSFFIGDWDGYGLGAPGYGQGWYRYYDDAVLAGNDGMIYDTRAGIDWDRYDQGPVPEYAGEDQGPPPPPPHAQGWRDDGVTWGTRPLVYQTPPGSTTTVIIQSAPTVTTHTYVEEQTVYVHKRAWKPKPRVRWHPPVCSCSCGCR